MKNMLQLTLLGSPRVLLDGQPVTAFATAKAQALLFYLAVTGQPHSRDTLAALLWDGMTDAQAKKNLRTVLPDLRRLLGEHLEIDRQTIAFRQPSTYWLDVAVLRDGLTPGRESADTATRQSDPRQSAVDLYLGEFLAGFYVQSAPAYDAWVLEQREQLHLLVVTALSGLAGDYIQAADYASALAANRRLLGMEPWSEPVHRQQMGLLARMGERAAALAQYESCRRILQAEFGVEPLPETTALYTQIRAGEMENPSSVATPHPSLPTQPVIVHTQRQRTETEHNLPQPTKLFGRGAELARLHKWIVEDGCRLVGIFGIGGQGKSSLAVSFGRALAEHPPKTGTGFARILWQSLLNAPPLAEVMQEWFYQLSDQTATDLPASLDQQMNRLLGYLRAQPTLIVLDNLESILHSDGRSGYYRPGYEGYGQLIRRLAESEHPSCLLITSREWPQDLLHLEEERPVVRALALDGLSAEAGQQIVAARGLAGQDGDVAAFVQHYSGNPLALNLAAQTVRDLFDGQIAAFLQADTLIFDNIRDVLDQQFARLTPLEGELMGWLAVAREPIPYPALRGLLAQPPAPRAVLEALRSLQRRSLLETDDDAFGLQNVVLEYTTEWLIDNILADILADSPQEASTGNLIPSTHHPIIPSPLNRHALVLAQSKEYVRASQTRLLLRPVAERLVAQRGARGAVQKIQTILGALRGLPPTPGYAAANLLHLLLAMGVDVSGYDFSRLSLRQLYLRGVSLPRVNFAQAEIVDSVFTEPFGLVYSAVFSLDGRYLAAGTGEGAIYLWRTADQQLAQVIQAHSQSISELAFGQRLTSAGESQTVLVSACEDKSIGFWPLTGQGEAENATHLRHPEHASLLAAGISLDGQRVTGVGEDGQVFVWEVAAGQTPRLVQRFATHPTRLRLIAFSADGQIVAVGNRNGQVQVRSLANGGEILRLAVASGSIVALALGRNRDRQWLATGGKEGDLCLWSLPDGRLLRVVETQAGVIDALAFSPDGDFLTSSHGDQAVRVWAIDTPIVANSQPDLRLVHTLPGHSQIIWSVAFAPRPPKKETGQRARLLVASGSSDQTVRVWDGEMGHSLYTLRGQPRALGSLAIVPWPAAQNGDWLLAAVGYDRLVHLWQGQGSQTDPTPRSLAGKNGPLYTVAISPDGRTLASAGRDLSISIWDVAKREMGQSLSGHTESVTCLVFHPAGTGLASGSTDGTVRLWEKDAAGRYAPSQTGAVLQANLRYVYDIAFHSQGHCLAAVGADLHLRLWDMTQSPPAEMAGAGKRVETEGEQDIFCVAFSPNGRWLACGGNAAIHLWERDGPPLILRQHTAWIFSLAFSPDGTLLASSSADATVCLWDVAQGRLLAHLRGHRETIYKVAFTPDGQSVVSCSFDGTIRFWDVATGECVNILAVEGPYAGMRIDGVRGVTEAQKRALVALGAVEG